MHDANPLNCVVQGIGPAMHRVAWIEVPGGKWKHSRLEIRAACGMRVIPAGDLIRPEVGEVTCRFCLEAS